MSPHAFAVVASRPMPPRRRAVTERPGEALARQTSGVGSGGRIRTNDLRVMSPTSYQTAPPRTNSASAPIIPQRAPIATDSTLRPPRRQGALHRRRHAAIGRAGGRETAPESGCSNRRAGKQRTAWAATSAAPGRERRHLVVGFHQLVLGTRIGKTGIIMPQTLPATFQGEPDEDAQERPTGAATPRGSGAAGARHFGPMAARRSPADGQGQSVETPQASARAPSRGGVQ